MGRSGQGSQRPARSTAGSSLGTRWGRVKGGTAGSSQQPGPLLRSRRAASGALGSKHTTPTAADEASNIHLKPRIFTLAEKGATSVRNTSVHPVTPPCPVGSMPCRHSPHNLGTTSPGAAGRGRGFGQQQQHYSRSSPGLLKVGPGPKGLQQEDV